MGGSVSRYPDGQLAMRAFDNGAGHACSESYNLSSFVGVCRMCFDPCTVCRDYGNLLLHKYDVIPSRIALDGNYWIQ